MLFGMNVEADVAVVYQFDVHDRVHRVRRGNTSGLVSVISVTSVVGLRHS